MRTDILVLEGVSLGQRVRVERVLRRWRQSDLADLAEVPQYRVSALERDAPVYPAARKRILAALDLEDPYADGLKSPAQGSELYPGL